MKKAARRAALAKRVESNRLTCTNPAGTWPGTVVPHRTLPQRHSVIAFMPSLAASAAAPLIIGTNVTTFVIDGGVPKALGSDRDLAVNVCIDLVDILASRSRQQLRNPSRLPQRSRQYWARSDRPR